MNTAYYKLLLLPSVVYIISMVSTSSIASSLPATRHAGSHDTHPTFVDIVASNAQHKELLSSPPCTHCFGHGALNTTTHTCTCYNPTYFGAEACCLPWCTPQNSPVKSPQACPTCVGDFLPWTLCDTLNTLNNAHFDFVSSAIPNSKLVDDILHHDYRRSFVCPSCPHYQVLVFGTPKSNAPLSTPAILFGGPQASFIVTGGMSRTKTFDSLLKHLPGTTLGAALSDRDTSLVYLRAIHQTFNNVTLQRNNYGLELVCLDLITMNERGSPITITHVSSQIETADISVDYASPWSNVSNPQQTLVYVTASEAYASTAVLYRVHLDAEHGIFELDGILPFNIPASPFPIDSMALRYFSHQVLSPVAAAAAEDQSSLSTLQFGCDDQLKLCYGALVLIIQGVYPAIVSFNLGHMVISDTIAMDAGPSVFTQFHGRKPIMDIANHQLLFSAVMIGFSDVASESVGKVTVDLNSLTLSTPEYVLLDYSKQTNEPNIEPIMMLDTVTHLMYVKCSAYAVFLLDVKTFELVKTTPYDFDRTTTDEESFVIQDFVSLRALRIPPVSVNNFFPRVIAILVHSLFDLKITTLQSTGFVLEGCPAGFVISDDIGSCVPASGGTYPSIEGSTQCPMGRYSKPGAHSMMQCKLCPMGTYSKQVSSSCAPCDDSTDFCPVGSPIRMPRSMGPNGNASTSITVPFETPSSPTNTSTTIIQLRWATVIASLGVFIVYLLLVYVCSRSSSGAICIERFLSRVDVVLSREHFADVDRPMVRKRTSLGGVMSLVIIVTSSMLAATVLVEFVSNNALITRRVDIGKPSEFHRSVMTFQYNTTVTGSQLTGTDVPFGVIFPLSTISSSPFGENKWKPRQNIASASNGSPQISSFSRQYHRRAKLDAYAAKQKLATSAKQQNDCNPRVSTCVHVGHACILLIDTALQTSFVTGITRGSVSITCDSVSAGSLVIGVQCTECELSSLTSISLPLRALHGVANVVEVSLASHIDDEVEFSVYNRAIPGAGGIPEDAAMRGTVTTSISLIPTKYRDASSSIFGSSNDEWSYAYTPSSDIQVDVSDMVTIDTCYNAEIQSNINWESTFGISAGSSAVRDAPYFGVQLKLLRSVTHLTIDVQPKMSAAVLLSTLFGGAVGVAGVAAMLLRICERPQFACLQCLQLPQSLNLKEKRARHSQPLYYDDYDDCDDNDGGATDGDGNMITINQSAASNIPFHLMAASTADS
jgi:hypothetical protein